MSSSITLFDALIIGAGPAGLSTATGLARQLHTAVVFDSGVYRNARAEHMHNVLGWDHVNPAKLREKGRADLLARYQTVKFADVAVQTVKKTNLGNGMSDGSSGSDEEKKELGIFEAVDATGKAWHGRKVVLATGVKDRPLDIEGFDECWGRGIFHCLFCDGYEERGQKSVGLLAMDSLADAHRAMHVLRMALRLADGVVVYTNGDERFAAELRGRIGGLNAMVDQRPIAKLEKVNVGAQVKVHLENRDGNANHINVEGFLVYAPATEINGPFAEQLGLETTAQGDFQVSQPFFETSLPGAFAVGDVSGPMKAVTPAVYSGTMAAGGVAMQVQAEGELRIEQLGI